MVYIVDMDLHIYKHYLGLNSTYCIQNKQLYKYYGNPKNVGKVYK